MVCLSRKFGKVCTLFVAALLITACVDTSLYENHEGDGTETKVPNSFDFSTVQKVKLNVDYSAFKTYGPVFFGVYAENPIIANEDAPDDSWNENVSPIYEDYTEANGKFSEVVELPAYAQHLYIATGNFFTGMLLMEADVKNGAVSVVAENHPTTRALTRATGSGVSTDDLSVLNLTSIIDKNGNLTGEVLYNDWKNWLGSWNSATGYPEYMLDKTKAKPELFFSDSELENLYETVGAAFISGSDMNEEYCTYPDLLLEKESEVTFTLLGGSTCWNSSLGYYWYTDDNKPTKPSDLHVVMLFPNTQDGQWARAEIKNLRSYNNNIGVNRGDVVQLKYYPNIANNDKTGATTVFPKGTRIGFVLKTQAWAMQGKDYSLDIGAFSGEKKYNVWCSTTDGLSYGKKLAGDSGKYPNPEGKSRGAKFSYKGTNGDTYTLISFEDAMDDLDFDDLIFALKPVGVFAPVPEIENKKSSTNGVYAFEDLWPKKGDYDLNDAVVNVKHEKEFNDEGKIIKETFYLTTYQNYVTLTSGLALTLETKVDPQNITMKKIPAGEKNAVETEFAQEENVFYLTNDFKGELGTTYILELTYGAALDSSSKMAKVLPFIYRTEGDQNWEVHIPMEAPTAKMNTSYFGTEDDCSDPSKPLYFVRSGNYPFAFYLEGANISAFEETILKSENESKRIDELFPHFLDWSTSKGTTNQDWYLKLKQ
jgi:LruC domain-containing protein